MFGRPRFIVFEGIDGSGKSTQAKLLKEWLDSLEVRCILTSEPTRGEFGQAIRSLSNRIDAAEEYDLFEKDRKEHLEKEIRPALESGATVICDRYVHSSVAYQGARGFDPQVIINRSERFATMPDIVFLIEVPIPIALSRIQEGRAGDFSIFEESKNLRAVDTIYKSLTESYIKRLDGDCSPENLHQTIVKILFEL
jgi:dTMP kinase